MSQPSGSEHPPVHKRSGALLTPSGMAGNLRCGILPKFPIFFSCLASAVQRCLPELRSAPAAGHLLVHRPEHSAASNLVAFSGDREQVSDGDLAEAAHFSKYAYVAYGYTMYLMSKPKLS